MRLGSALVLSFGLACSSEPTLPQKGDTGGAAGDTSTPGDAFLGDATHDDNDGGGDSSPGGGGDFNLSPGDSMCPAPTGGGLSAMTAQASYAYGDGLTVSGTADNTDAVSFVLRNPIGNLVGIGQTTAGGTGSYTHDVLTFPSAPNGQYPAGTYRLGVTSTNLMVTVTLCFELS